MKVLPDTSRIRVGEVGSAFRESGRDVPLTDIAIAVAAVRADAAVWAKDHDFQRIKRVLPDLDLHGPR